MHHEREHGPHAAEVIQRRQDACARRRRLTDVLAVDHADARALAGQAIGDTGPYDTPADDGYVHHDELPGTNPFGV